jgi:hypothetical protein
MQMHSRLLVELASRKASVLCSSSLCLVDPKSNRQAAASALTWGPTETSVFSCAFCRVEKLEAAEVLPWAAPQLGLLGRSGPVAHPLAFLRPCLHLEYLVLPHGAKGVICSLKSCQS